MPEHRLPHTNPECDVIRPIKELKGFEKVELAPGEQKTVQFTFNKRAFAYWEPEVSDWCVAEGEYGILVGASSRDIRLQTVVKVEPVIKKRIIYTKDSAFGEVYKNPEKAAILMQMFGGMTDAMQQSMPQEGEQLLSCIYRCVKGEIELGLYRICL